MSRSPLQRQSWNHQPAASRLIADLAKEFDFPLFDKRDGQLVPSQEVRLGARYQAGLRADAAFQI